MKASVISKSNKEEILEWKFMVGGLQHEPFQIKVKHASEKSQAGGITPFTLGEQSKRKVYDTMAKNRSDIKTQV